MAVVNFAGRNIWTATNGSPVTTFHVDSDRRDIDVSKNIADLVPEATPYLTILMKARKVPIDSLEAVWFDNGAPTYYTQVSGAHADSSDTTIDVDDGSFIRGKDLIKNTSTGEVMFVSSVSTNELTVIRQYGYDSEAGTGTAKAAMADDDYILRLGPALEENSSAPDTYVTQPTKYWNYVQTMRTPFDSSMDNTLEAKKAGENPRIRLRKEKLIEHRLDIEKTAIWGERNEITASNRRLVGGAVQYITSNSYDVSSENGGILTEAELENICATAFKYKSMSGRTKLLVTSHKVCSIVNQFAAGRIQTVTGQESYGMRLQRYISFHGDLILAPSMLFENDYEGTALILDMENIMYRPFAGNDSKLKTNIQSPDLDGWKDEYMTKYTIQVRNQETHMVVTGISA
jgi:hypothetical protein